MVGGDFSQTQVLDPMPGSVLFCRNPFHQIPFRRKPILPNPGKVHSMSKCSCIVDKKIILRIFNYIF